LTVSVAVAEPPLPERLAVPRVALPRMKVTVPLGDVEPEEAFTLAVSTVEAVAAMLAGLAVSVVVVGPPVAR